MTLLHKARLATQAGLGWSDLIEITDIEKHIGICFARIADEIKESALHASKVRTTAEVELHRAALWHHYAAEAYRKAEELIEMARYDAEADARLEKQREEAEAETAAAR